MMWGRSHLIEWYKDLLYFWLHLLIRFSLFIKEILDDLQIYLFNKIIKLKIK